MVVVGSNWKVFVFTCFFWMNCLQLKMISSLNSFSSASLVNSIKNSFLFDRNVLTFGMRSSSKLIPIDMYVLRLSKNRRRNTRVSLQKKKKNWRKELVNCSYFIANFLKNREISPYIVLFLLFFSASVVYFSKKIDLFCQLLVEICWKFFQKHKIQFEQTFHFTLEKICENVIRVCLGSRYL